MVRFRTRFRTYAPDLPPPPEETSAGPQRGLSFQPYTRCAKRNRPIVIALEDLGTEDETSSEDDTSLSEEETEDESSSEEDASVSGENWSIAEDNSLISRRLMARGSMNGKSLDAIADSGASFSVISQELAGKLGLIMDQTSVIPVHLPSGRVIRTLGKVAGLFSFSGEDNSYPLLCIVLEKSVYPLVLGSHFLRITQTLTKYTNRIKKVFSNILGLNFLGFLEAEQSLLAGYLNDHAVDIVPDTGSDIMVMSLSFADRLGLTISEGRQDKIRVQFIDGSEAYTLGRVRGVRYKSHWYVERGNRTIYGCDCDFYIIQHLPVDAIVSNEFVEEVGVFENHMYRLKSRQPKELQFGIYGIRYIGSPCARQKEQSTLDHSFSAEMEESELHRRDAAVEDIEELLATDPSAAESRQRDEWERRARNDRKRKHDEGQMSSPLQTSRIHTGGTTRSARQTGTGSLLHEANTDQRSAESSYQQMAGQALTLAVGFDAESGQPQTKRRRFYLSRWLRGSRTG